MSDRGWEYVPGHGPPGRQTPGTAISQGLREMRFTVRAPSAGVTGRGPG